MTAATRLTAFTQALELLNKAAELLAQLGSKQAAATARRLYASVRDTDHAAATKAAHDEAAAVKRHGRDTVAKDSPAPAAPESTTPAPAPVKPAPIPSDAGLLKLGRERLELLCKQHRVAPPPGASVSQIRRLLAHKRDGKLHHAFDAKATPAPAAAQVTKPTPAAAAAAATQPLKRLNVPADKLDALRTLAQLPAEVLAKLAAIDAKTLAGLVG